MRIVLDCETNALKNPTTIHCVVAKDLDDGEIYTFTGSECYKEFPRFIRRCSLVVGHNIIGFDAPILRNLVGSSLAPEIVRDTLVISRLLQYTIPDGHSLESWGGRLGVKKVGVGITDWSRFTPEMLDRCISDAEINALLYQHLMEQSEIKFKGQFRKAIKVEHEIAWICQEMHETGFGFDIKKARALHEEISAKVQEIDRDLETAFPPTVKKIELKTKTKEIIVPFNPGSPRQIVERLKGHWKPTEFTGKGQPKVSETNLATLSDKAPKAAQRLVERLMLASRERTLEQWFKAYNVETRRIHSTVQGIGTWTHRCSHREPNLGNVAAPKSIKYHGKVLAELATSYGGRMRELWGVHEEDTWLVGTDAEGIQLRIFGHYINDEDFIKALVEGRKEDATDPHSFNARILDTSRDSAKTWIYAFLLGAGDRKLGEILGVSSRGGREAKERFIRSIPGLEKLKQENIRRDAKRGYIIGFDGRLVGVPNEHKVMAAYLQTGEACIMKHSNVLWRRELNDQRVDYRQTNFIHDEWQTEVRGSKELAEEVGVIQAQSISRVGELFGLRCPMAGNYTVGKNWLETH